MTGSRAPTSPFSAPSRALVGALVVTSILSIPPALAMILDWDYLRIGYHSINSRYVNDIAASGMEIWSVVRLATFVLMVAWAVTIAIGAYQAWWRRPRTLSAALAGMFFALAALLLAPGWMDFQVRYYISPATGYYIQFGNVPLPLLAYDTSTSSETFGDDSDARTYLCPETSRWKLAGLTVSRYFYPSLDEKNERALLQRKCRPVKAE